MRFSICVSQGTFPHSSRLSWVETSPGASGFGRGNGAEKCQGLAGTNGFFGAVKAEVFVSFFFFFRKNFGSCVGVCFFRCFTNKRITKGTNTHWDRKTGTRIGYINQIPGFSVRFFCEKGLVSDIF